MAKKMAKKTAPSLSEAQLEVMDIVWDRGEATVAEVWRELARRRGVARNTVYTVMTRLIEKGWLATRKEGSRVIYSPLENREPALKRLLDELVNTAFRGSTEGLVMTLLSRRRLSSDEARRIRALITEAEARERRSRK